MTGMGLRWPPPSGGSAPACGGAVAIIILVAVLSAAAVAAAAPAKGQAPAACSHWVAPDGDDDAAGTAAAPWATLDHAAEAVPDASCTVWFKPGVYPGPHGIERRFTTVTTFRSLIRYEAVLEDGGTVLQVDGARNVVIEGFELRHDGSGASGYVAIVDQGNGFWSEHITFRNNIFHDSFDNDLLKIHNGVRFATVVGNLFYNQGDSEQHMDINSVTDVVIQDNVLFNDFAGSGREISGDVKHFIVVKDSNEGADGLEGSERITIRRNVFFNWEGGQESFVKIGNDGKSYHEAEDVLVESNLMIGNSPILADAAFGVRGAKDVTFRNNTVVGDLPAKSYAFRLDLTGDNPPNENIHFFNNIWADPTGTMGAESAGEDNDFADGDPSDTIGLVLDGNLYWNGGEAIPAGEPISPTDDPRRIVANPGLETDHSDIIPARWTGDGFADGSPSIRAVFESLAERYAAIPADSPAANAADPDNAAATDILGRVRLTPDVGAYEEDGVATDLPPGGTFVDDDGNVHEGHIEAIAAIGVTRGCNPPVNDRYCPGDPVTRGQMAAFLSRILGLAPATVDPFVDDEASIFQGDINRIAAVEITKGCNPPVNDRFCPDEVVTRAQMAAFLVRAYGYTDPGPGDRFVDDDGLAFELDIDKLATAGVTLGCDPPVNSRYCPHDPVLRDQMASFLGRAAVLTPLVVPPRETPGGVA